MRAEFLRDFRYLRCCSGARSRHSPDSHSRKVHRVMLSAETRLRVLRVAPALLAAVGGVYIVLIAVDSRPIADDWSFIPRAQQWGFGRYMGFYLGGSGRFSQFALTWLTGRLFGSTAVNIVPLGDAGAHARIGRLAAVGRCGFGEQTAVVAGRPSASACSVW